ncbi:Glucose-induced degradation protein 8 [Glycine soja]
MLRYLLGFSLHFNISSPAVCRAEPQRSWEMLLTPEKFIAFLLDPIISCEDFLDDKFHLSLGIFHFALEGNALKAIELTEQLAKDILENNKDLQFDLLSLHFVELVCSRKCTEALEFAQTKLGPFGKEPKYMEKLEDFMALLAYKEPEKSPMFHLLSLEYRQQVADSLNRAILGCTLESSQLHSNGEANTAGYSCKTMLKSRSWQGCTSTIFLKGFSQKLMENSKKWRVNWGMKLVVYLELSCLIGLVYGFIMV